MWFPQHVVCWVSFNDEPLPNSEFVSQYRSFLRVCWGKANYRPQRRWRKYPVVVLSSVLVRYTSRPSAHFRNLSIFIKYYSCASKSHPKLYDGWIIGKFQRDHSTDFLSHRQQPYSLGLKLQVWISWYMLYSYAMLSNLFYRKVPGPKGLKPEAVWQDSSLSSPKEKSFVDDRGTEIQGWVTFNLIDFRFYLQWSFQLTNLLSI